MLTDSQRDKLRTARQSAGLTVRAAATKARISHSAWTHIETGRRASNLKTLQRMAHVVGLDLRVALVRRKG